MAKKLDGDVFYLINCYYWQLRYMWYYIIVEEIKNNKGDNYYDNLQYFADIKQLRTITRRFR